MSETSGVLVIMEQAGAGWHRISSEALAAGKRLANELHTSCSAAVLGTAESLAPLTAELANASLSSVYAVEHPLLARYTADGFVAALQQLFSEVQPSHIVFPHTYQVRDYAPALATRLGQVLLSDVTALHVSDGIPAFTRQWMGGKLNADYRHRGSGPCLLSVQAGSFRADASTSASTPCEIKHLAPQLDASQIRTSPGEPFREAARTVDLGSAQVIVSVGRGIGEQENLKLVEDLARALGAELAASRPICDAGWLPMERQVGSSGQTVAPKVYVAIGISGAIQHLVGMKGARTVVAINKDPDAPIFEVADVAAVGDLFEILPALTRALRP
ncbi:MAG TPA: electron transfer flavoprotein subunit alpha/FixB family protein [Acidobacteriaceae bacterium]|jgi:electron transfer flavoprotein alpha subunit|nr:electron transfer flavoprotein subunit alpha/FixB family protein [Acidobacteriaceae bacterium]